MGKRSVVKGGRVEREIVKLHKVIGVHAERVPLSGSMRYQGNGEDLDIYPWGRDAPPLCCQVKALNGPRGTKGILDALGEADALFLRYDAEPGYPAPAPTVVVPWATWERLMTGK
jgi:hypothetical protein